MGLNVRETNLIGKMNVSIKNDLKRALTRKSNQNTRNWFISFIQDVEMLNNNDDIKLWMNKLFI